MEIRMELDCWDSDCCRQPTFGARLCVTTKVAWLNRSDRITAIIIAVEDDDERVREFPSVVSTPALPRSDVPLTMRRGE